MSALLAVAATPIAARAGARAGLVDRPGALKVHERPIPTTGGLSVVTAALVAWRIDGSVPVAIAGAMVAALIIGMIDDRFGTPPAVRLVLEAGTGVLLAAGGAGLSAFGPLAATAVIAATVAIINGVNMIDGLDGLAAGTTALSAIGLAFVGAPGARPLALALAGALTGFLIWNRRPARVFLGDGGAYATGAGLTALVALASAGGGIRPLAAAICCLGMVAVEPIDAIVRRVRAGSALTGGDRDHTYDRLGRSHLHPALVVPAMWGVHAVFVTAGIMLARAPRALPLLVFPVAALAAAVRTKEKTS